MERGLTGRETVTAGVALQFLFAVFTVEVIFTGGAEVHWKRERERKAVGTRRSNIRI